MRLELAALAVPSLHDPAKEELGERLGLAALELDRGAARCAGISASPPGGRPPPTPTLQSELLTVPCAPFMSRRSVLASSHSERGTPHVDGSLSRISAATSASFGF